jgi:hypothetical protein
MSILKKIKEFFNEPDPVDLIEQRFYERLERLKDMKANPEKYTDLKQSSDSSKIPPVSLF